MYHNGNEEKDLLHPKTIPRTSRERLQDFLLVIRKACVEPFGACGKPALGDEAVALGEVVGRAVGCEVRDADTDLFRIPQC